MGGGIIRASLLGGLVAGALDFVSAIFLYKAPWDAIARSVASGWLGAGARSGGTRAIAIGLGSHFALMTLIAAVYVLAARRIAWLKANWIVGGLVFGLCVYGVMNAIVVPLSAAPPRMPPPDTLLVEAVALHMILIGVPIAWFARRA